MLIFKALARAFRDDRIGENFLNHPACDRGLAQYQSIGWWSLRRTSVPNLTLVQFDGHKAGLMYWNPYSDEFEAFMKRYPRMACWDMLGNDSHIHVRFRDGE